MPKASSGPPSPWEHRQPGLRAVLRGHGSAYRAEWRTTWQRRTRRKRRMSSPSAVEPRQPFGARSIGPPTKPMTRAPCRSGFWTALVADPDLAANLEQAFVKEAPSTTDRCTFAYAPDRADHSRPRWDQGSGIATLPTVHRRQAGGRANRTLPDHWRVGPIPTTHPIKLSVPGWMSIGVAHCFLRQGRVRELRPERDPNASIGYEAADALGGVKAPRSRGRSAPRYGSANLCFSSGRGKPSPPTSWSCSSADNGLDRSTSQRA